ncbi:MAG: hypothetical protein ACP5I8_14850 [Phycisphaerae bacterium]
MTLDNVNTREEAIQALDGYSSERQEELTKDQKTGRPLLKTYMLETVPPHVREPSVEVLFAAAGVTLTPIDETLFRAFGQREQRVIGLVEKLLPRYPVFYSLEDSHIADRFVKNLVQQNAMLDRLWISGRAFADLFKFILGNTPKQRYGRMVFQYANVYESADYGDPEAGQSDSETNSRDRDDGDQPVVERRSNKTTIVERLSVLEKILPKMRGLYQPLNAIAQLRFPATGRGGHDFFFNGKVTNRSDSFKDHRQHVEFVLGRYKLATELTEQAAWGSLERTSMSTAGEKKEILGAPVYLVFQEALSQSTFETFVRATFSRKHSRFGLWGDPVRLGPTKVHVYAVDRHIWQPLFLEITDKQIVAIVPNGTCGNTINRLVTNVQQYLDPAVDVWVGDQRYDDLLATRQAGGESETR